MRSAGPASAQRNSGSPRPANRAGCRSCGDIIESTHRHDYVTCRCGAISVDGGSDYQRRLFKDAPPVELPDDAALKLFEHRFCGTADCCGTCV